MQARRQAFLSLYASVVVATLGYGISFPLLSLRLEQMGLSGCYIGLNSAMPALGWLIGALFLPKLHGELGLQRLLIVSLAVAIASALGFWAIEGFWAWTVLRFLFGGALGLFFRCIEYWINGVSSDLVRGRNIGIYSVCFMIGIAAGSALQPALGTADPMPLVAIAALLAVAASIVATARLVDHDIAAGRALAIRLAPLLAVPVAAVGALAYGLLEDIPAYLMSVYAMRNGLGATIAAYTLTAAAVGNIIMPIPLGMLSDRIGRMPVLVGCATIAAALSASMHLTLSDPTLFLVALVAWGGCLGALYNVSLAVIGDRFRGGALVVANAAFGIVYSLGSLVGPMINGSALDMLNSHGLMVSAMTIFLVFVFASSALSLRTRRVSRVDATTDPD